MWKMVSRKKSRGAHWKKWIPWWFLKWKPMASLCKSQQKLITSLQTCAKFRNKIFSFPWKHSMNFNKNKCFPDHLPNRLPRGILLFYDENLAFLQWNFHGFLVQKHNNNKHEWFLTNENLRFLHELTPSESGSRVDASTTVNLLLLPLFHQAPKKSRSNGCWVKMDFPQKRGDKNQI